MKKTAPLLSTLALVVLAACATDRPSPSAVPGIPVVKGVGPGSTIVDPVIAASLYERVCVDTGAKHSAMQSEIAKLPFSKNPDTGTFYHKTLNLSFKMVNVDRKQACSFVAKPTDPSATVKILAATTSSTIRTTAKVFGIYVNSLAVPK